MSSSSTLLLLCALLVALCIAHPQYRQLKCATPDGQLRAGKDAARCHMIIKDTELETPGRPAPEGDGCFTEEHDGEERVYCDLVCPKAHTVFHASINQGHRACFNYFTYQLEKRADDWYMWRSGKCLNSTATWTIGCKFDEPFRTQFPSDAVSSNGNGRTKCSILQDVFARLRARKART